METYFRASRYNTSEQRVTYEAEYNTDITVEPMYRFLSNMNHGSELPYGLAEARRFSHVQHLNADDDGHLSVIFGIGEEGFTGSLYTGPLRDDEIELKAKFFQDIWFWKFTLLTDWEASLELFGDIADFVNRWHPPADQRALSDQEQNSSISAAKIPVNAAIMQKQWRRRRS